MNSAVELLVKNINKKYGEKVALSKVSLALSPGIYGLLGPNGAGKSTLMNIITGNIKLDSGEILYNGENIFKMGKRFRKILGYMPQQQNIYPNFTGWRFLNYIAALKGMTKKQAKQEIIQAARLVNLEADLHHRLGSYSGGMKQRILIAQAILNQPQVLILDEPTAGLDPKERIHIRNLISKIALNKIVIIATHVVSDIEFIAKEIIVLKNGRLLTHTPPQQLIHDMKGKVFTISTSVEEVERIQKEFLVSNIVKVGEEVQIKIISDSKPINFNYKEEYPSIEEYYLYHFGEVDGINYEIAKI